MFCEARGWGGCHLFYGGPKGGTSLELRGGVTFFKGIQKGGQKNRVNQNENLQTPPPPLIKNDTSLTVQEI